MTLRTPPKLCPECVKHSRNIGMMMTNLGRGRSRLVAIWACPICRYEEGNLL